MTSEAAPRYLGPMISYPEDGNASLRAVEEGSFWFRHRNEVLLAALERFRPEGVLWDVGGGNGFVARALQDAGHETVLVEPGPVGAENARRLGVKRVVEGTLDDAEVDEGSLAAIGVFDVLEHMADDRAFLTDLHRRLRPGGRLYVTVPAYASLWSAEDVYAGHHRRYDRRSLGRALGETGFECEYLGHFFWILPLPIALLRVLPSRLGLRRGAPDAETAAREHGADGAVAGRLLSVALAWEPRAVAAGRTIPFGGSLLCVAQARA